MESKQREQMEQDIARTIRRLSDRELSMVYSLTRRLDLRQKKAPAAECSRD